jgi:hypothetical protein
MLSVPISKRRKGLSYRIPKKNSSDNEKKEKRKKIDSDNVDTQRLKAQTAKHFFFLVYFANLTY